MALAGAFLAVLLVEKKRPLRQPVDRKARRFLVDACMAAVSSLLMSVTAYPIARSLSKFVDRHKIGVLPRLPRGTRTVAGLLMLDYTIYLWHVLLHKIPLLWRFHIAHHTDRDLDALTSLRFHFGELFFSIFWRALQIVVIGVPFRLLSLWEAMLACSVVFHHSNIRLSPSLERTLNLFIVSPRIHGIHHSVRDEELNSNWSSGLTLWDRFHGTFRAQAESPLTIGIAEHSADGDTSLAETLFLPFRK